MTEIFDDHELLLRAVYPADRNPNFWKGDRISSAAFKDKKGLSVSRTGDRGLAESVSVVKERFTGFIVSVTVPQCRDVGAFIKYLPISDDKYHSEIHNSQDVPLLDNRKAKLLARAAIIQYSPI